MIKVIHFIHGLNMGGAETLVKDYALGVDRELFDVTILCYEKHSSIYESMLIQNNIKIVFVSDEMPLYGRKDIFSKAINSVMRKMLIKKYVRNIHPDIIHIHMPLNSYIKFAKPEKSVAMVYTQHFQVETWINKYKKDVDDAKWLLNHYKMQMIALNEEMKNEINEEFGVDNTLIFNNGIDIKRFQNGKSKCEIRDVLNIPQDAFVVGHVGRFADVKNHMFLIDVFYELCKIQKNAVLLLIGRGENEKQILSKIEELKMKERVIVLKDRNDIPDLLKTMDLFVFPSKKEGLGISLIEAQIASIPCLVSNTVPKETKISNKIEYLGLEQSAEVWAKAGIDLVKDKSPIEYYDVKKWDIQVVIKELEKLYIELKK